jgi:hypothetical protein
MVELQDDDVAFSAVDTGMLLQVLDDLLAHLGASPRDVFVDARPLALMVLSLIPRVCFREAITTPRLQLRLATSHRRKRFERLHFAAFRARSHEGERADWSTSREQDDRLVPWY